MIRRAEEKDLARVNDLLEQVLTVHAEARPDIFIPGTKKYRDEELLAIFADDSTPVFVFADEADVTQGYAFCTFEEIKNSNNMRDMKTLYIDDVCVDEACRGQHIATQLYEYVREYAKAEGCDRITLNVWEVNPTARAFYDAMGMKPLKTVMEEKL
ncbi:MAG: GNAT family N-acetyltransferase [Bacillota bacterium]|nr:GNAT family N-acetyltransferase [Bacillota bacterium]